MSELQDLVMNQLAWLIECYYLNSKRKYREWVYPYLSFYLDSISELSFFEDTKTLKKDEKIFNKFRAKLIEINPEIYK